MGHESNQPYQPRPRNKQTTNQSIKKIAKKKTQRAPSPIEILRFVSSLSRERARLDDDDDDDDDDDGFLDRYQIMQKGRYTD
jgi:hypothetical protein